METMWRLLAVLLGVQIGVFSPEAFAGNVQDHLDAIGGCQSSSGPMMMFQEFLPQSDGTYLGKSGADWTDDDLAEFRRVYSQCLKRWPGEVIGVFRVGEPIVAPPGAIEAKVEERIAEIKRKLIDPARAEQRQQQAEIAAKAALKRAQENAKRDASDKREKIARDAVEQAAQLAKEDARARRYAVVQQAENDRKAAEQATKLAETEAPLLAQAERKAQEAHLARLAAEKRLEAIRQGVLDNKQKQLAEDHLANQEQAKRARLERQLQEKREDEALAKNCSVSAAQFQKVALGMSLREVRQAFGCVGTLTDTTHIEGMGTLTVFQWDGVNGYSVTTFSNDRLVSKSQSALE